MVEDASAMGLKIGLSPDLVARLRQAPPQGSSSNAPIPLTSLSVLSTSKKSSSLEKSLENASLEPANKSTETSPPPPTTTTRVTPKLVETPAQELPHIQIQLDQLIGYQPEPDELESIRSQLLQAMWTRYRGQNNTEDNQDSTTGEEEDIPPPDFDTQVLELYETGVATYIEQLESNSKAGLNDENGSEATSKGSASEAGITNMKIAYPSILQSPTTPGDLIATKTLVQQIQSAQPILEVDFVQRLWKYLRQASRGLFWKRDMAQELSTLIREEQARMEYEEWTQSKQQTKLDSLYSIRETLVHQVEMAKAKLDVLEEERDLKVQEAMGPFKRKQKQKQSASKDTLEGFVTTDLSFPDDFQWLGLRDEPIDEEDDYFGSEQDEKDYEDYDDNEDDPDGVIPDVIDINDSEVAIMNPQSPEEQLEEADAAPMEDSPTSTPTTETETKIAGSEEQDVDEAALTGEDRKASVDDDGEASKKDGQDKEESTPIQTKMERLEDEFRNQFTTKDLIVAQTTYNALEEKMNKTEELLESLQDEVWDAEIAAEEENENKETSSPDSPKVESRNDVSFSLVDQILAMILGGLPIQDGVSPEEHYQKMRMEHKTIVNEWQAHFGRLPPPAGVPSMSSPSTPRLESNVPSPSKAVSSLEKRQQLGIQDNDQDDWDAIDDWDDLLEDSNRDPQNQAHPPVPNKHVSVDDTETKPIASTTAPTTKPKVMGLRPGGSA